MMNSILAVVMLAAAGPAMAQQDVFAGDWLQERMPYESETGRSKLFVSAGHTTRTGDSARTRILVVDETVDDRGSWTMWDANFDCAEQTMRLVTRRVFDSQGVLLTEQTGTDAYHPVDEPHSLWRILYDFSCHGENGSLSPIIGDIQNHARSAFSKPRERDPFEGLFE